MLAVLLARAVLEKDISIPCSECFKGPQSPFLTKLSSLEPASCFSQSEFRIEFKLHHVLQLAILMIITGY